MGAWNPWYTAGMNRILLLPVLGLACAGGPAAGVGRAVDPATPACVDDTGGPAPTWAEFGEPFFLTWCQGCHATDSPQRYGAPAGVAFDTPADVRAQRERIADSVLVRSTMPVGGGLGDAERADLEAFLCAL